MLNKSIIDTAIQKRAELLHAPHTKAFRLINGFLEDLPGIVVEVFGCTLLCHDYRANSLDSEQKNSMLTIINYLREKLPFLTACVVKHRRSETPSDRNGFVVFGTTLDTKIQENGVWYSLNLTMNQDSSFYLDTENLRIWMHAHLNGKTVLNTFAYTGSLGVAALTGCAAEVIQLDLSYNFLAVGRKSTELNEITPNISHFQTADFWSRISQYKKTQKMFDCVVLDPPVYAKTKKNTIDIAKNYDKLINKVRPIINDGGYLITISNALFQSGETHAAELEALCKDGYLKIEKIIDVPAHCIGNTENIAKRLPADPAPYNHSTKITILRVKRKSAV